MTPIVERDGQWSRVAGRFWRAVPAGREVGVLEGTVRAGRYNRPGERTLYMSASREGVAAATARYGERARVMVGLQVEADRLIHLQSAAACPLHGAKSNRSGEDWIAALDRGETPASWLIFGPGAGGGRAWADRRLAACARIVASGLVRVA